MTDFKTVKWIFCLVIVVCMPLMVQGAAGAYEIESCSAKLELLANGMDQYANIKVILHIDYLVTKAGKCSATLDTDHDRLNFIDIREKGKAKLRFEEDDGVITWNFFGAVDKHIEVQVTFLMLAAAKGTFKKNFVKFEGLEAWDIPWQAMEYTFIYPKKPRIKILGSRPARGKIKVEYDCRVLTMQASEFDTGFYVQYSPGFILNEDGIDSGFFRQYKAAIFIVLIIIALIIIVLTWSRKTGNRIPRARRGW
ncbi:MAG: hypothetical protein GY765_33835 [bacterium]|nr:hypothetical protein [bacterium]